MSVFPATGWLVREALAEERWLAVEFFLFIPTANGVSVIALALVNGFLTAHTGRLKRAES